MSTFARWHPSFLPLWRVYTLPECCLGVKLLIFLHFCFYHADLLNCHFRVRKILNLRIFDDDDGKRWMKSVTDKQFEILCVSQVGCCSAWCLCQRPSSLLVLSFLMFLLDFSSPKNPMLHANLIALCFIELELWLIEVLHCRNRDFWPFLLLWSWPWPEDLYQATWP